VERSAARLALEACQRLSALSQVQERLRAHAAYAAAKVRPIISSHISRPTYHINGRLVQGRLLPTHPGRVECRLPSP
jgi:hypothetical protein